MANGKYQKWLTDDGLILLEGWARDGLTEEQISKNMGINVRTLSRYKNEFNPICQALKSGKEVIDIQVENALLKRALGYKYEEVKTVIEQDAMGRDKKRIEKTTKEVQPDVAAQIFWLKNRKREQWRNNPNAEKLDENKFEHTIDIDKKRYW